MKKKLRRKTTKILTIAGADPSGGAGVQADLRTFHYFGLLASSVVTAVTAQNEKKFISVNAVSAKVLRDQLHSVGPCDFVKIGMLGTKENAQEVIRYLKKTKPKCVVLDPVLCSTTGTRLLEKTALPLLIQGLFPLCTLVTPNLLEASILTDLPVTNLDQMKAAAITLLKNSPGLKSVLIKGGHLQDSATDLLYDGKNFHLFSGKRFSKSFHGTGCVLSSAILAELSQNQSMKESVSKAKKYVSMMMR